MNATASFKGYRKWLDVYLAKKLLPPYPAYSSMSSWFYHKHWLPKVVMPRIARWTKKWEEKMKDPQYYYWNVTVPKILQAHGLPPLKDSIIICDHSTPIIPPAA